MEKPPVMARLPVAGMLLFSVAASISCSGGPEAKQVSAAMRETPQPPYFGQPTPGMMPQPFAPGLVNTDAIELNGVFTPDGRQFLFTRIVDSVDTMFSSVVENGSWTDPAPLLLFPDRVRAVAVDMSVSPDGQTLYFVGQHPHEYAPANPGLDLWMSRQVDGAWSTAQVLPPPITTPADELYPVVVADGSLYFSSSRAGGLGPSDTYRAQRRSDGTFAEPVNLGPPINNEAGTGDTFVAPDESYMIFSSRRTPSLGNGDLFVSFRLADGSWGEPTSLGDAINTGEHEFCPMVTPDGKYLMFSRLFGGTWAKATGGDVFWVDARILDRFRKS
jgi:hypothetical protein